MIKIVNSICASFLLLLLSMSQLFANDLVNGGSVNGTIAAPGQVDTWTFTGTAGELATLSVADTSNALFDPEILLFAPNGEFLVSRNAFHVATMYNISLNETGTYVVQIRDGGTNGSTQTGNYRVQLAKSVGANEHGLLVDGGFVEQNITIGDLDTWRFNAVAGDLITLSLADTSNTLFDPEVSIYDPDGRLVVRRNDFHVAMTHAISIAQSGSYLVMINDGGANGYHQVGDYQVHFAKSLGTNEHGSLLNGGFVTETITRGDIDTWRFDAVMGEQLTVTLADISGSLFDPEITLFTPDGQIFYRRNEFHVNMIYDASITQTGTYVVMVNDGGANGRHQGGDYEIHMAKSTNTDEHGLLPNGGFVAETITAGDLDTWSFEASVGERINLTVADTSGATFDPEITLFSPNGETVVRANAFAAGILNNIEATQTGRYAVMVNDGGTNGRHQTGNYEVHFAKSLGANEHGQIFGSGVFEETITLGDLDTLTFYATQGEKISLRMIDTTSALFDPNLVLYTPDGAFFTQAFGFGSAGFTDLSLPQTGLYTILMKDGPTNGSSQGGEYRLEYALADLPPDPEMPVVVLTAPAQALKNMLIELDGSASFDPDNSPDPLSFEWEIVSVPQGSSVSTVLVDPNNSAFASIVSDVSGVYRIALTVSDGLLSDQAIAEIMVLNQIPFAEAGDSQQVNRNDTVFLDGSASFDPDGDTISYQWRVVSVPNGSNLTELTEAESVRPSFIADTEGTFEFELVVNDGEDNSAPSLVSIRVEAGNLPPQAIIEAINGQVNLGDEVSLDGTSSVDPDNGPQALSYLWSLVDSPDASVLDSNDIVGRNANIASFLPDTEGDYVVSLRVDDGEEGSFDIATVTFQVQAPSLRMCDEDANLVVDRQDIRAIMLRRNTPANGPDDVADWNKDGVISVRDARGCVSLCDLARCATPE